MNASTPLAYCPDLFRYQQRRTREVLVGGVGIGGDNPIRIQSMITADTRDTEACVKEVLELAEEYQLPELKAWEYNWPDAEPPETDDHLKVSPPENKAAGLRSVVSS